MFGPLGIFFGYRAQKQGNQSGGTGVMIASGLCMVIGIIIGAMVISSL